MNKQEQNQSIIKLEALVLFYSNADKLHVLYGSFVS